MTLLKNILNWLDNYTGPFVSIVVGVFLIIHQMGRPNLKTQDDLMTLEGNVTHFSFKYKPGYKATLMQYYIRLDNYPCTFQIKADFLPYFYQSRFEDEIQPGNRIRLVIPKESENQLGIRGQKVFIFSVSKNGIEYLILKETIKKENDYFDLYAGAFFILFGGGTYYVLKKRKSKKKQQQ